MSKIPIKTSTISKPVSKKSLGRSQNVVKVDTNANPDPQFIPNSACCCNDRACNKIDFKLEVVPVKEAKEKQQASQDVNGSVTDLNLNSRQPIPIVSVPKTISQTAAGTKNSLVRYNANLNRKNFCPFNSLEDKPLKRIFGFLNHSDLLVCRTVQRRWKTLISANPTFLQSTVYVVNIKKTYNVATDFMLYDDLSRYATLPFVHARFQYIDSKFLKDPTKATFRNSDNDKYFPATKFLQPLSSLEFRNCFLYWNTVKRFLVKSVVSETLSISNCFLSDELPTTTSRHANEFDEFTAGNAVFGLKKLEIYEVRCLANITLVLRKFIGYTNQALSSIKITYHPPADRDGGADDSKSECYDFCRELKVLITLCANSLEVLVMDIQHEATLSLLGYHVCKDLEALRNNLNLTEFKLSPVVGCWLYKPSLIPKRIVMTGVNESDPQKCVKTTAVSLARFIKSQRNLQVLGLPCIGLDSTFLPEFKRVLEQIPCAKCLSYLAVPCAGFLPEDFMRVFPMLKELHVGETCCQDFASGWEIFQLYTNNQNVNDTDVLQKSKVIIGSNRNDLGVIKFQPKPIRQIEEDFDEGLEMLERMAELHITTSTLPDNFIILAKSLPNLTTLDISSGVDIPVISDEELQGCIKYLKMLRSLLIGCCDKLTDYGLTGIPLNYTQAIFKNQDYRLRDLKSNVWNSQHVTGRPLSDLKGLRKLVLIGTCAFTDIGIAFGMVFTELKYCHLPYSDYITSWGIERFGKMNPSVEAFVLSGVNQLNKEAFLELRRKHDRIRKGDSSRSGYFMEQTSPVVEDFSLVLATPESIKQLFVNFATKYQVIIARIAEYFGLSQQR